MSYSDSDSISEAACAFRDLRSSEIIKSLVFADAEGRPTPIPCFVLCWDEGKQKFLYVATEIALKSPQYRDQALKHVKIEIEKWCERSGHFDDFADVLRALEETS